MATNRRKTNNRRRFRNKKTRKTRKNNKTKKIKGGGGDDPKITMEITDPKYKDETLRIIFKIPNSLLKDVFDNIYFRHQVWYIKEFALGGSYIKHKHIYIPNKKINKDNFNLDLIQNIPIYLDLNEISSKVSTSTITDNRTNKNNTKTHTELYISDLDKFKEYYEFENNWFRTNPLDFIEIECINNEISNYKSVIVDKPNDNNITYEFKVINPNSITENYDLTKLIDFNLNKNCKNTDTYTPMYVYKGDNEISTIISKPSENNTIGNVLNFAKKIGTDILRTPFKYKDLKTTKKLIGPFSIYDFNKNQDYDYITLGLYDYLL
jgi:hypothetical protein